MGSATFAEPLGHEPVFWLRTVDRACLPADWQWHQRPATTNVLHSGASAAEFHRLPVRPAWISPAGRALELNAPNSRSWHV
jgi:hypothetical protein